MVRDDHKPGGGGFGNLFDQEKALQIIGENLKQNGKVIISHPLGRKFVSQLQEKSPSIVPYSLPTREEIERLVRFTHLRLNFSNNNSASASPSASCLSNKNQNIDFTDEEEFYCCVLRKEKTYRYLETMHYMKGKVSVFCYLSYPPIVSLLSSVSIPPSSILFHPTLS